MTDTATLGARSAELYYTYARAVDEADLDTLRSIVTDDVLITRGDNPTEQGVEKFLDVYRAHNALQRPGVQARRHQCAGRAGRRRDQDARLLPGHVPRGPRRPA